MLSPKLGRSAISCPSAWSSIPARVETSRRRSHRHLRGNAVAVLWQLGNWQISIGVPPNGRPGTLAGVGDMPDAVLVARLIIAGGDRDFDRAQPFGLEQIGDRPADPGQVKDQFGVAEEGRVAEQPMHMPHNAGIRRSERQALQVAAAEGRLAVGRLGCAARRRSRSGRPPGRGRHRCRCPCDR